MADIRWWIWRLIIVVLVVAGGAGLYHWLKSGTTESMEATFKQPLAFTKPARQGEIVLHGEVEEKEGTPLLAPVDGTIIAVVASEGRVVAAGELVAQIKPHSAAAAAEAEAEAEAALASPATVGPGAEVITMETLRQLEFQQESTAAAREQAERALQQFEAAKPEVVRARAELEKVQKRSREAARAFSRAMLEYSRAEAELTYENAGENAARLKELHHTRENIRRQNQAEKQALDATKQRLQAMQGEVDDYEALRRELDQLTARHEALSRQIEKHQRQVVQIPAPSALPLLMRSQTMPPGALCAPLSGELRQLRLRPGMTVKKGEVLGQIESFPPSQKMVFGGSEAQAEALQVGMELYITTPYGRTFKGRVSQLSPEKNQTLVYALPIEGARAPVSRTSLVARSMPLPQVKK